LAIDVQPGERPGKIPVVTVVLENGQHLPLYALTDSSGVAIDSDNALPVNVGGTVSLAVEQSTAQATEARVMDETTAGLLSNILKEIKIMNLHLSMMTDNEITKAEID